jgi:hypothetical protein
MRRAFDPTDAQAIDDVLSKPERNTFRHVQFFALRNESGYHNEQQDFNSNQPSQTDN